MCLVCSKVAWLWPLQSAIAPLTGYAYYALWHNTQGRGPAPTDLRLIWYDLAVLEWGPSEGFVGVHACIWTRAAEQTSMPSSYGLG